MAETGNAYAWNFFLKAYGSSEPSGFKCLRAEYPSPGVMCASMADENAAPAAKEEKKAEAPKKEQPKAEPPSQPRQHKKEARPQHEKTATSIIRMGGKDINGELGLERALMQIKGVGSNLAHSVSFAVEKEFHIQKNTKLGSLSEEQIESIESVIKDPAKYGIPKYMINRRNNPDSGVDSHLIGSDLTFAVRQDVNRDVGIRTWRGYRHQHGQKVRGQHTKSTGRTGATVGVMKKAAKQQLAAAQQEKGGAAASPAAAPSAKK